LATVRQFVLLASYVGSKAVWALRALQLQNCGACLRCQFVWFVDNSSGNKLGWRQWPQISTAVADAFPNCHADHIECHKVYWMQVILSCAGIQGPTHAAEHVELSLHSQKWLQMLEIALSCAVFKIRNFRMLHRLSVLKSLDVADLLAGQSL